jgi:hypothetical protein
VVLDIGASDTSFKMLHTEFEIPNLNLYARSKDQLIFSITPVLNTTQYHDQIFINIRYYELIDNKIKIGINCVRSTNELWGLHLTAHLLITII